MKTLLGRKSLEIGENMLDSNVAAWTQEQRRLGGAWSKHEIMSGFDRFCAPYDWVPAWTTLSATQIQEQLNEFYND